MKKIRKLREALWKNERRLREAQRLAQMGHWEVDHRTKRVIFSENTYSLFEIKPSTHPESVKILTDVLHERVHPDDRDSVIRAFSQSLRDNVAYDIGYRLLFPGGRLKWLHARGASEYDDTGTPLRSIGTVQDISDRVRRESQIQDQVDLLNCILSTARDGFWLVALDGRILDTNDANCAALGYSAEELKRMRIQDIETSESAEETTRHLAAMAKNGNDLFTSKHRKRDGGTMDVEVSATFWAAQERIVAFSRDISERVQQKCKLEQYSKNLETMVEQRTGELREALEEARLANKTKSDFFERISHELYTPLNAIIGFSQLLEAEMCMPLHEGHRDSLLEILNAGRVLQKLVDGLLEYSKEIPPEKIYKDDL
ncbi:MAG: hypothetical protein A2Y38_19305 [Spirochaetes bacterium GWB1_59_5]|nr:MAG: hypothetical protein A2Y38_19305 [Spirochaetes bacterium GWB1_59_5]